MKWLLSSILILGFWAGITSAQDCPDTLWTRVYPDTQHSLSPYDTAPTGDGGVILCGATGPWPWNQVWTARTDSLADTLWTRTYGEPDLNEGGLSVIHTNDDNFVIAGWRGWGDNYDPNDSAVVYVLKINGYGDTLWTRTYGRQGLMVGWQVIEVPSGGYAIAGTTNYFENFYVQHDADADSADMFLLRIAENGDSLWFRTYGGHLGDEAFCLQGTSDGGFFLAGVTGSFADPTGDVYLVRTDSAGNELWSQTYGHPGGTDYAFKMVTITDHGLLLAGESYIAPGSEALVIRVDSTGALQWDRTYRHGFSSVVHALTILDGDSFAVAISSLGGGGVNIYAIWGTPQGEAYRTCDYRLPPRSYEAYPCSINMTSDGGYLICGSTGDLTNGAFLLRTEPDPLDVSEPFPPHPSSFSLSVFPNPFNAQTHISLWLPHTGNVNMDLYNIQGQLVQHVVQGKLLQGQLEISIDASDLSSGIYFLHTQTLGFHSTQKLILLR